MDTVRVSGEDFRGEDARGDIALVRDALHAQVLLVVHEVRERRVAHLGAEVRGHTSQRRLGHTSQRTRQTN